MPRTVDLSADIGESFGSYRMGRDEEILDSLTSANVACGFHAGDPRVMQQSVAACVARGVAVGAHPGFPDLVGFGRRAVEASAEEVRTDVLYQIGALAAFARAAGTTLTHVSPHGRLGNLVVSDEPVRVDSVLLHGDNEASVQAARQVRAGLEAAGVRIAPLTDVLAATSAS